MAKAPRLDQIDLRILEELQSQGRIDNNDLAEAVGLTPSPCLKRVRALEAAGYIKGYHAQLNLAKLGESQIVFAQVTLASHRQEAWLRFEAALAKVEALLEAHRVGGGFDYLLKFIAPSLADYEAMLEGLLGQELGIAQCFSFVVFRSSIQKAGIPLEVVLKRGRERRPAN